MRFATAALALAISIAANAQQFPTKTVRFISGVTPGAASDTMARLLAEKMTQTLGHPVIVENRLGAGGLVGAKYVADAEPDGHTIMMYAVTPPGRYKTVKDFVAAAKAEPGKLVCTDAGTGSSTHMAFERFRFAAGFEALNVHTKGPGEALTEVISGRADCYFALVFQAQKMRDAGKLDALVVSALQRTPLMKDLPTTEEAGYPNSAYNFWVGALVSAKTPRPLVERLHKEITTLVQSPEISAQIRKLGAEPLAMSIAEFDAMIKKELVENADLIKKANIKAN